MGKIQPEEIAACLAGPRPNRLLINLMNSLEPESHEAEQESRDILLRLWYSVDVYTARGTSSVSSIRTRRRLYANHRLSSESNSLAWCVFSRGKVQSL